MCSARPTPCVHDLQFVGNSALSSGGGLAVVDQASVLVSQTSFVDNVASLDGGGVSLSAQLNITSSSFARNKATRSGGAFYMAHVRIRTSPGPGCRGANMRCALQTTLGLCSKTWLARLSFQSNQATRGGGGALFTTWSQLTGFNSARRLAATAVPALCIPDCHDCSCVHLRRCQCLPTCLTPSCLVPVLPEMSRLTAPHRPRHRCSSHWAVVRFWAAQQRRSCRSMPRLSRRTTSTTLCRSSSASASPRP